MSGATRRQGGFTLIELLVAIMILTLFMTASMGAVRIASRSWSAGQERADATEELRSVAGFLRRQLAQMPRLRVGEGDDERITLIADEQHLRFVAPAPQFAYGPGLITYELAVETIDDRAALTLTYAPFDPGAERFDEPLAGVREVLALDFETIRFSYFGAQDEKSIAAWQDSWAHDAELFPQAVRIRTRDEDTDNGWPDLVLALRSGELE